MHVALAKPSEYVVRSARNTIRVELKPARAGRVVPARLRRRRRRSRRRASRRLPSRHAASRPAAAAAPQPAPAKTPLESIEKTPPARTSAATIIERIKSSKTAEATTVTLVGNGQLEPVGVTESKDRRAASCSTFRTSASKAPAQTAIDSPLVSRVRVALNSHQPLVTRVVMEIAPTASYHVERTPATAAATSRSCSSGRRPANTS